MRIDGSRLISIKPELIELLKELKPGDIIKGRVLEALANSIVVRTAAGQVLTAVLQEDSRIQKGAFIELIIRNIADGKIFAELITDDSRASDTNAKLSQIIKHLGLPVDEKSMEALRLLIKYKLPVSKETITNIIGLQKSIESLNNNTEAKAGLLLSEMDIKNTPVDVLNKAALNFSKDLGDIVSGKDILAESSEKEAMVKEARQPASTKPDQAAVEERADGAAVQKGSMKYNEPAAGRYNKAAVKDDGAFLKDNEAAGMIKVLNKIGIEPGIEVRKFADKVADILASIKGTDMESIVYLVSKGMEATPKNIGMLLQNINNSDGVSKLLDKLQKRIDTEQAPELKEIKESIRKIFLEPRQVEDSKKVSEQLKDMAELGEKLERYLNSNGNKDAEIKNTLSTLKDNIDFIIRINEHCNYLQVPVLINRDTATAKLYVFKEGRRSKAINPENATVLVALDLKSLGHIESLIGVTGKTVSVTFRVQDKSISNLIEKQRDMLKNALEEKGFNLNALKVISLEQPFSLLSLEALINESGFEKIHFDMRV